MYSYVTLEQRIAADHSARQIRAMVDRALGQMEADLDRLYSTTGRPSMAPERLLRALLLMVLYSIRSERQLLEQLSYNLLFRWFVGLEMDDPVWDVTVFAKNRERLIAGEVSQRLLCSVLSEEHFTVDGALIQAWAAARSFKEKSDPPAPGSGFDHQSGSAFMQEVERGKGYCQLSRTRPDGEPQRSGGGCQGQPIRHSDGA
jgi:transposase